MGGTMGEEYERALEAFLVGRYLKENGLSETLEYFLKETPVKMVPKMPEDMQSLSHILKAFRRDRDELKEKRRRIKQFEEILNLLFKELQDVYNFRSSSNANSSCTPPADQCAGNTLIVKECNSETSDGPHSSSDFNGNDAGIIETFRNRNSEHRSMENSGRMVPVVLPNRARQSNVNSSEGLHDGIHDDSTSNNYGTGSRRSERQPIYSRAQTLEHHYNRIRAYRRLNQRSKYRNLEYPASSSSSLIAYSSLPVSNFELPSVIGHNRQPLTYDAAEELKNSRKIADDKFQHGNVSDCVALQSASCEENANPKKWGVSCITKEHVFRENAAKSCSVRRDIEDLDFDEQHDSSQGKTKLLRRMHSEDKDVTSNFIESEGKKKCLGSDRGSYRRRSGDTCSLQSYTIADPTWTCSFDTASSDVAENSSVGEEHQYLERSSKKYVSYGGDMHYKAFLREKFFKSRRKERPTMRKQEQDQNRQLEDEDSQKSLICKKNTMQLKNDSDSMESFINNIDSCTPRSSPRDLHDQDSAYSCRMHSEPQKTESLRSEAMDVRPANNHASQHTDEIMEKASVDDDSSVLAELEEAVGQTVDEILRRYVLVSPPLQTLADP
ncbi:hypothetical protein KP509_30G047400 [Ceratopteris richardii]|uniref:LisH domain-containing protein n=1 Tax=Ceratopteris richardii TaxID=49495 RepID=A0A8T2R350_CERRI|nr:hypothetical protein KP509_30G047400 [Ceratopteris richardii]